jgi:two-component system CheB/CheR fusion protein
MDKVSVLVVDDSVDSADGMRALLELDGFEAFSCCDGKSALDLARQLHPDVVLLDLGMPDPDGLEVCRRLKSPEWPDDVRIIVLTGWAYLKAEAFNAGCDTFLLKPVPFATLRPLLEHPPGTPGQRVT